MTTFSTFQVELLGMARENNLGLLFAYGIASVTACFAAAYLATALTRRVSLR